MRRTSGFWACSKARGFWKSTANGRVWVTPSIRWCRLMRPRSGTFVFNIDERFFGTIIAYVPGAQAAAYDFTSGLPVQLLKVLAPKLMPLVNARARDAAATGACVN